MTHKEVLNELKEVRAINTSGKEDKYTVDSFVKISNESLDKAIEALENQKTGHWIYIGNSQITGLKIVECSECGNRTYGSGKFCPNCGAKMKGE